MDHAVDVAAGVRDTHGRVGVEPDRRARVRGADQGDQRRRRQVVQRRLAALLAPGRVDALVRAGGQAVAGGEVGGEEIMPDRVRRFP